MSDRKRHWLAFTAGCAVVVVLGLIVAIVALRLTFKSHRVGSMSMEPTVSKGDLVVVRRGRQIDRGDLVSYRSPRDGTLMFHRVIGLPGDVVELRNSAAIVNGKALHEPYIQRDPSVEALRDFEPITVPPQSYFLLGDNRDNANDSRYLGFVKRENITGEAVMILSKNGGVEMLDSPR